MFEGYGKYDVILADPAWKFRTWNATNSAKSAAAHYDLMSLADIKAMPVARLAAPDCVLVCWGTQAQGGDLYDTVKAWGFEPKSLGAWLKLSKTGEKLAFGTGYRYRSTTEFYLLGTRGNPKQAVKNIRNAIIAPVREHSRKPDEMHEQLEAMFPEARKIELFARARRLGWDAWGNQTDKFAPASAPSLDDLFDAELYEVDETGI